MKGDNYNKNTKIGQGGNSTSSISSTEEIENLEDELINSLNTYIEAETKLDEHGPLYNAFEKNNINEVNKDNIKEVETIINRYIELLKLDRYGSLNDNYGIMFYDGKFYKVYPDNNISTEVTKIIITKNGEDYVAHIECDNGSHGETYITKEEYEEICAKAKNAGLDGIFSPNQPEKEKKGIELL